MSKSRFSSAAVDVFGRYTIDEAANVAMVQALVDQVAQEGGVSERQLVAEAR